MSSLTKPFLPLGSRRRAWARRIYKQLASLTGTDISTEVAAHRSLPADALAELEAELRTKYFNRQSAGYLETEQGRCDLANHLTNRLETARSQTVPWLESVIHLHGARVLEIGSGTGSGIVALAERGAQVIGVDLDEGSLQVAHKRCTLHGVVAELHATNAANITELFSDIVFDLVIFYASLEHMVLDERLRASADSWAMLRPGKLWCVIETPNRLWHTDTHTALLPF